MKTHGQSGSPTYRIWAYMIERCTSPKHPMWGNYGGRGIKVCERWRHSFSNFLADMGTRPAGLTLDRIDSNKGYEPGNCRWATRRQQSENRTANRLSYEKAARIREMREHGMKVAEIARQFGVHISTIERVLSGERWNQEAGL